MSDTTVRLADDADRPVLDRLWALFQHDLSEFRGVLPHPDGSFRSERLEAAFADGDRVPYLVTRGNTPSGSSSCEGWTVRSACSAASSWCAGRVGRGRAGCRP